MSSFILALRAEQQKLLFNLDMEKPEDVAFQLIVFQIFTFQS